MGEKYCHFQSDVTMLIHTDLTEQQCETSSPADYFTTSCFLACSAPRLVSSGPWHQGTLCCCLSLIPSNEEMIRKLTSVSNLNRLGKKSGLKAGQCGTARDITWCLNVDICVWHMCVYLWTQPFCSYEVSIALTKYLQLIPCAGAVWVKVSQ